MHFANSALLLFFICTLQLAQAQNLNIHSIGVKAELLKTEIKSKSGKTLVWKFADAKEPHLIQGFNLKGELVLEKLDNDTNKIFEKVKEINAAKQLSTEKYDLNQDGKFEKIKKIQILQNELVVTDLVLNNKGEFEMQSETTISLLEALGQSEICDVNASENPIFKNIKAFTPLIEQLFITEVKDGFSHTSFGPKIHESCMKQFGESFPALVQSTLRDSLNCLSLLDGPGSRENLTKIASILENKDNPLKLRCGEDLGSGAAARATIPGDKGFPSIAISKTHESNPKEIKDTVFHELLHNCGHIHHKDHIEYMYSCPDCCERKPMDKTSEYCKMCRGDYTDPNSFEYIRALGGVRFSTVSSKIATELVNGKFSHRKDGPLLYLNSIQYSSDHKDIYAQLYSYYKEQGVITADNATYLRAPDNPQSISTPVRALAEALSKTSPSGKVKSISYLAPAVNEVIRLPKDSELRMLYTTLISDAWTENRTLLKKKPEDAKLKAQEAYLWNMYKKVNGIK